MDKSKYKEYKNQILKDGHLGFFVPDESQIINPLSTIPEEVEETPELYYTYLLSQPENFWLTCKEILNVDLHPMQVVILQQIWNHKFPMLVGSRGFGKMLSSKTLIRTKGGWTKIEDINVGDKVYGGDGKLCNVIAKTDLQENLKFYIITLRDGRKIKCCEDHLWKVWRRDTTSFDVVKTKDIYEFSKKFRHNFSLPLNGPLIDEAPNEHVLSPYSLGFIIRKGCFSKTRNVVSVTIKDKEEYETLRKSLEPNFTLSKIKGVSRYGIVRKDSSHSVKYLLRKYKISNSITKRIPKEYLYDSLDNRRALLSGLLGDSNEIRVKSKRLVGDILNLVRSLGIYIRQEGEGTLKIYDNHNKTLITDIKRTNKNSGYCIEVDSYDKTYITKDYIVTHNSFILAVYALLRILLLRKRKVIICGAGFRQSKIIFQYMESIINNSPILKGIITQDDIYHGNDGHVMTCKDSTCTAIPIGAGNTIRGLRGHDILSDEFASIPLEIFETVIAGFASVSANPTENARSIAIRKIAKKLNFEIEEDKFNKIGNQIVISGTAFYSFNHFSQYHDKYKKYIKSRGNIDKIKDMIGDDIKSFNYKDYCIMRIPVDMIPEGFMDASLISRARATVHTGIFQMEYGAVFSNDSTGFYNRRLIESCVIKEGEDMVQSNGKVLKSSDIMYYPRINGEKHKRYVMGVDPAMTQDNFSIVIVEVNEDYRKVVYCWTTNKKDHIEKMKSGITQENNYYAYCSRKIRNLMSRFNIVQIAIDAQGGGLHVMESLNDDNFLNPGEVKIWPIIDYEKPKETDLQQGLHIIDVIQFTKEDWTSKSNHGMKKDMEDKVLLFPFFDALTFMEINFTTKGTFDSEDTVEKIIEEIEELKNELCTITVTTTAISNREHFDTPEYKTPQGKKGRLRKDRYSALLMANMSARCMQRVLKYDISTDTGDFATNFTPAREDVKPVLFTGNSEIARRFTELYE